MPEIEHHSEIPPAKEKYSKAEIFEHLFPGCHYADLPLASVRNVDVFFGLYTHKSGYRDGRFCSAVTEGKSFAEREELSHPNRMTLSYYIGGLTPAGVATHPTFFRNNSFADLVDIQLGEKLGGAATRPVSWEGFLAAKLAAKLGMNPYIKEPEYIIGVLNKDNQPCAIIHFGEGKTPRLGKLVEAEKSRVSGMNAIPIVSN